MALSTSTAKIQFNVGRFDYTTGLTLPDPDVKDTITFAFPELVSPQLTNSPSFDPAGGAGEVYGIVRILFNGEEIYENSEWDTLPTFPSYPDFTVDVTDFPSDPEETYTTNAVIDMIKNSNGVVANGTYTVSIRWFYQYDGGGEWATFVINYPAINFVFTNNQPDLTFSYDSSPSNPFLNIGDATDYKIASVTATSESEYVLYPPQNGTIVTTFVDNANSVTFNSFKTGGNEFRLTSLLTYEYTLFNIVTAVQGYEAFTVYLIDNCAIYECLNTLYNNFKTVNCSTKAGVITQQKLIEANAIALKLLTGQGCDKSLSTTLAQFQALCDCDCDCLDDTPRVIQRAITAETSDFQIVTATGTNTTIDLTAGRKIRIITAVNTEIFIDSTTIVDFEGYQIEITASAGTPTVTWDNDTIGWTGGSPVDSLPTVGAYDIFQFTGNETLGKIMLTSSSLDVN